MSSDVPPVASNINLGSIDDEHREIIDLIHQFDTLLRQGSSVEQVVDLFAVVLSNTRSHFREEEQYMLEVGHDGYRAHKEAHDRLLDELEDTMKDCEDGAYSHRYLKLAQRVSDWFVVHMQKMDEPMLNAGGTDASPIAA